MLIYFNYISVHDVFEMNKGSGKKEIEELKYRNISLRRRSIFRERTGSRTAFLAGIVNL